MDPTQPMDKSGTVALRGLGERAGTDDVELIRVTHKNEKKIQIHCFQETDTLFTFFNKMRK